MSDESDYQEYLAYQAATNPANRLDESYLGRLKNNLVAAADAASFGLADEGAAATRAGIGSVQKLLGYEPSYQGYDKELEAIRGGMKDYQAVHPYQALASSLIGGAASAVPFGAGEAATEVVPSLLNTFNTGAKTGALYGGAYGFGSGEGGAGNRMVSALLGAGTGAAGGAVIGGTAYGVGKGWQMGRQALAESSAAKAPYAETGAIMVGKEAEPQALAAEQAYLAKRLRNIPTSRLEEGQAAMEQAVAEDSPMFLPESVDSPSVKRLARFLAGNEASMDTVQNAVQARKSGALDRVSGILDEVSPQRDPIDAGEVVQGVIGDIKDSIIKSRKEAADPLYAALRKEGSFESKSVEQVVKGPRVQQAIKAVRKDFPEYDGLPDTHFDVLDKAQQWLRGQAEATKNNSEAGFIKNVQAKLVKAMDTERPNYAAARATFADESTPLNALFGDKKTPLTRLSQSDAENVGSKLLGMDKGRLSDIADEFGTERAKALKDAVRAALQGKIEGKKDNQNLVSDIVEVPAMREKLRVIIGNDEQFDRLMRLLGRENTYARSANLYNPGSTTAGNLQEAALLNEGMGKIAKLLSAAKTPIESTWKYVTSQTMSDDKARALASLLTDTNKGVEFYQNVIPQLVKQRADNAAVQAVAAPLGQAGGIATELIAKDKLKP